MDFDLLHAGCYRHKQEGRQYHRCEFIALNISGRLYSRSRTPSGRMIAFASQASIGLLPRGVMTDFAYSEKRENYVLQCNIQGLRWQEENDFTELEYSGSVIRLPFYVPLSQARCFELREKFITAVEFFNRADPLSLFAAEQIGRELLSELALESMKSTPTLADRYRAAIDNDLNFSYSLAELAVKEGYSPAHARRCFTARFGIDPKIYRNRRRLNFIMGMLAQSKYAIKEIADAAGMKNVTHLYTFLQKECGQTPGALRRNLGAASENKTINND